MLRFRPEASIVAHHGNVKEARFDVDFFRRFHVVGRCRLTPSNPR